MRAIISAVILLGSIASANADEGQCFTNVWVCNGTSDKCLRKIPIPCDFYSKPNAAQRFKELIRKWGNEIQPSDSGGPNRSAPTGVRG